jgi:hypothetical protein
MEYCQQMIPSINYWNNLPKAHREHGIEFQFTAGYLLLEGRQRGIGIGIGIGIGGLPTK